MLKKYLNDLSGKFSRTLEGEGVDALQDKFGFVLAAFLCRIWLAVRALQTGLEKFTGTTVADKLVEIDGSSNEYGMTSAESIKEYGFTYYKGVPEALYERFSSEPLMFEFALKTYNFVLGPALIILGTTILVGAGIRLSLFLLGMLYISLTWGLILIGADSGISWLGVHVILVVQALMLSPHNRFCVTKKW